MYVSNIFANYFIRDFAVFGGVAWFVKAPISNRKVARSMPTLRISLLRPSERHLTLSSQLTAL